jgi:hypothetical protein
MASSQPLALKSISESIVKKYLVSTRPTRSSRVRPCSWLGARPQRPSRSSKATSSMPLRDASNVVSRSGWVAFSAAMNGTSRLPRRQDVLLGEEGRHSREQITLHPQHPHLRGAAGPAPPAQPWSGPGARPPRPRREPVPQTRLRDLQIPSQPRQRVLAIADLIELPSALHGTTTELRRMRRRHLELPPAASAANGRRPRNRGNSKVGR